MGVTSKAVFQTLLDVLLTNTPELFIWCGVYPEKSDHYPIYGEMTDKIFKHKPNTITFRQTKNTDLELLTQDLIDAPWHIGDISSCVDDKYDHWRGHSKVLPISMRDSTGKE